MCVSAVKSLNFHIYLLDSLGSVSHFATHWLSSHSQSTQMLNQKVVWENVAEFQKESQFYSREQHLFNNANQLNSKACPAS